MEVNFTKVIKELANKGYFMSSSDRDYIIEEIENINYEDFGPYLEYFENSEYKSIYWDNLCENAQDDEEFMNKLHEIYSDEEFEIISDLPSDYYYDIEKMICKEWGFNNLCLFDNFVVTEFEAYQFCIYNDFIEEDEEVEVNMVVDYIIGNYSDNLVNINEINKEEVA